MIAKVGWTSPAPRDIGAIRTAYRRGGIVGRDEYIAREPYRRMAFRFNGSSAGTLAGFAEDYRVEPTTGGCRTTWTTEVNPLGPARLGLALNRGVMDRILRSHLSRLRTYTDDRCTATPQ